MNIKSPIIKYKDAVKIEEIPVENVIEVYNSIGVPDAGRFFKCIDKIGIYKCKGTGYRFYYPYSIFGDNQFYDDLQKRRKYYADWRWEHGIAFDQIESGQKVLEIGCGTGNFLKRIKE